MAMGAIHGTRVCEWTIAGSYEGVGDGERFVLREVESRSRNILESPVCPGPQPSALQ